jgi:hypothetical protein
MKISVVFITNGNKSDITSKCIESVKLFANEIIVVGNIKNINHNVIKIDKGNLALEGKISEMRNIGSDFSSGDIVINVDDDIWFPPMFGKKFTKFIRNNNNFTTLTTKVIGVNGSRYWDRPIHTENGESFMIDYNQTHPNLYYSGAFIVREKWFTEKYKWDGSLKYYEKEDVEYSNRIKKEGYSINIDTNNYVVHLDPSYISYKNENSILVCDKLSDLVMNEIQEKEFREIFTLINQKKIIKL